MFRVQLAFCLNKIECVPEHSLQLVSAGGLYDRRRWRSFPCNRDVTLSDEARDKMIEEKVRESLRGKQTESSSVEK